MLIRADPVVKMWVSGSGVSWYKVPKIEKVLQRARSPPGEATRREVIGVSKDKLQASAVVYEANAKGSLEGPDQGTHH